MKIKVTGNGKCVVPPQYVGKITTDGKWEPESSIPMGYNCILSILLDNDAQPDFQCREGNGEEKIYLSMHQFCLLMLVEQIDVGTVFVDSSGTYHLYHGGCLFQVQIEDDQNDDMDIQVQLK